VDFTRIMLNIMDQKPEDTLFITFVSIKLF